MRQQPVMKMRAACAVLGIVFGMGTLVPAAAETHAVVVGINKYKSVPVLEGADADAEDIAAALRKAGVTDLVKMTDTDGDVTREKMLGAIDAMISRVHKDDLAIITYAGHGGREKWGKVRPPGTAQDAIHEIFLLQNMIMPDADGKIDKSIGGSAAERILGSEMAVRLKRLDDLGARTIFVADSCFGGGMTRQPMISVRYSVREVPTIAAFADGADPLQSEIKALPAPIDIDKDTRSLSFLAAVDPDTTAPEVIIPKGTGQARGALSYAFARVIEGAALQNGKTELTHGDLVAYARSSIKTSLLDSGTSQRPDLRPRQNFDRVAIKFGTDLKMPPPPVVVVQGGSVIRVYTENGKPIDPLKRPEVGLSVEPTTDKSRADLVYRPDTGEVFSADGGITGGDLIATKIQPVDIQDVAERLLAVRRLVEMAKTRARVLTLDRGDLRYLAGDIMSLDARRPEGEKNTPEYYLLVVISGDGKVQFLYPLDNDPRVLPATPLGQNQAVEPFGADLAVFVVDDKPMDGLIKSLRGLHGSRSSNAVASLIEKALTPTMRIGLQGIYTAPRPQ